MMDKRANIGLFNRKRFWCGAFDTRTLKVVEVHKIEEAQKVDFNTTWLFSSPYAGKCADELFEDGTWHLFYFNNGKLRLQIEDETLQCKPFDIIMWEGIKALIMKQIKVSK